MKNFLLSALMLLVVGSFAQFTHTIDFEAAGTGADWTWVIDQNASNPALEFVTNPSATGINTSTQVAKFTALQAGMNWALTYTDDDGEFTFDAGNSTVKIMVYKDVISNIAIKFEGFSPAVEIQIPNTVTGQWEEIEFDFSGSIGNTYSRLVVIPDFVTPYVTGQDRTQDNIVYFDNIQVPDGVISVTEPTDAPTPPTHASEDVLAIYTEDYTDITGTDFNPFWGQSTVVTVDYVAAGNNTLRYENLNYQGTQFATTINVSGYEYLHVDFWTANSTDLGIYLISPPVEVEYLLIPSGAQGSWQSVDIPLSAFAGVDLANVLQFKVDGNGTIFFDNWYFWKNPTVLGSDATLSDLQVDGTTVPGFSPLVENYSIGLVEGTTTIPQITAAIPNDPLAFDVDITQATAIPGDATVVVTAQDETTTKTYTVSYVITTPNSVPPTPTQDPADVISMFSDSYTDVGVDTWLTVWSQGILEDLTIAGNPVKKYSNLNFAGIETTGPNLIDASGMTHFHIDVWTPDNNDFKVKLVDWGADGSYGGGDDTEHELVFAAPATGTWISYDLPLSDFINLLSTEHLAQYILSKGPIGTVYIDNVYFYNQPTTWTGAVDNDWHTAGNWSDGIPGAATDVTVPAGLTNYPTIAAAASCNNIVLASDASGTATILDNGNLTVNGTATVNRYYATGGTTNTEWHLIGSPVSDATASVYTGYYMQSYDEVTDSWNDITSASDPLTSLQGFAFYAPNDGMTFSYVGTLGTGTYNLPVSAAGPVGEHWNMFGNPYPSSLDFDLVAAANIANLQSAAVYYLDQASGAYVSYNGGLGAGTKYLAPGQGFFVSGAVDLSTFTVDNTMRSHMGGSGFYKADFDNLLVLSAEGNGYTDNTYLRFDEEATSGTDKAFDAFKIFGVSNPELPQIYTLVNDVNYSINVLQETDMVAAGFKAGVNGIYTISLSEDNGFATVMLVDLVTGVQTDLLNEDYSFSYNTNDLADRFEIYFTMVGLSDDLASQVNIYANNDKVNVILPESKEAIVSIYNTMGQEIINSSISETHNTLTLDGKGVYIVKVSFDGQVVSRKLFLN